VEAGEEAWYWGAPLPDGTFNAAVFLAPEAVRAAGSSVARLYRRLLGESTLLAPCLEGRMERGVLACDASALAAAEPVGPDWIRAGDAAFTIDPLSSQGVQTAIGSALQASIVVHTLLTAPEHASAALEFYRTRCDELARRHTQLAAAHYAERHARRPRPFWKQRSAHPANPAPAPPRAAFPERICPEMRVALSPEASLRGTPCIVDSLVVRRPALHHPGLERPAAYFNGVEIGSLLAPLDGRTQLKRLLMEWGPLMPAPQAWGLAGWLLRAGVLVPVPD
jgi:hypothetical protein